MAIARAAALSRAFEFAGLSPTISGKFLNYYEGLDSGGMFRGPRTHVDDRLRMKIHGELTTEFSEASIVDQIRIKNAMALNADTSEIKRLAATGYHCTEDELTAFNARVWDYDLLHDWAGFGKSLPATWKM